MPRPLRTVGFVLLLLAVAGLAFAPIFASHFTDEDLPYLVRASAAGGREALQAAETFAARDGPLARWSLALSCRIWTSAGRWTPAAARMIRVENVVLLLGAAALGRLALRRAIAPWAGRDGARASSDTFAILFACHPLGLPAVASAGARGDLLAVLLGAAAALLFLRGRQEKRFGEVCGAGLATLLAGHASAVALLVPPLLAVLELFSARRHRALHVRLRTSATTLLVFGACAAAESLTGSLALSSLGAALAPEGAIAGPGSLLAGLGAIALPVPRWEGADAGAQPVLQVLGGALLLAALHPALLAARSAPRLWGWIAATTSAAIAFALLVGSTLATGAAALGDDLRLFPGAVVACFVLALASTAVSGLRRVLIPLAIAASFVVLSEVASVPWRQAGEALAGIEASLGEARSVHGGAAAYLVVDPPPGVRAGAYRLILDPSVCPRAEPGDTAIARALSREALLAFAAEPEFARLRRTLVLLEPPARSAPPGGARAAKVPPPPAPSSGVGWRPGDLRSELFDVDPLEKRALRAQALPTASTAEAPRMGWRTGETDTFSATGVWIAGPDGPLAYFDLSRNEDWLFGARVHRAWLEPEVGRIAAAELLADAPPIIGRSEPTVPTVIAGTWRFAVDPGSLPRPAHGETRFVLALLDLEGLRYLEVPAASAPADGRAGEVVFAVDGSASARGVPWAFSLELRCGDACLARSRGRR